MVPESSLEMVTPIHSSYQKNPKELSVYTRRKKCGKDLAKAKFGLVAPVSEAPRGPISFANESFAKQAGSFGNLGEGCKLVLNHVLEFCGTMGLEVEGKEYGLFEFLFALETTRKKPTLRVEEEEAGDVGRG